MDGVDAAVLEFLGELAVPVDVVKGLAAAVGLDDGFDFDAKVVVPDHGEVGMTMAMKMRMRLRMERR